MRLDLAGPQRSRRPVWLPCDRDRLTQGRHERWWWHPPVRDVLIMQVGEAEEHCAPQQQRQQRTGHTLPRLTDLVLHPIGVLRLGRHHYHEGRTTIDLLP